MTDTATPITDAEAMDRARTMLGESSLPPSPSSTAVGDPSRPADTASVNRPVAIVAAVVVLVVAVSVFKMAWLSEPGDTTVNARIASPPATTGPATKAQVATPPLVPAALLIGAPAGGTATRGLGVTAWPGAVLTAPAVRTGKATAWQWQTCDAVPPKGCADVDGITKNRWAAPAATKQVYVRAIVTVQLSAVTSVRVASAPVLVLPWPEGKTPNGKAPSK